ncbi:MAG TPA: SEC-C metal-binding domain-containing protein [Myxococcota bacterium]|nr:SEC-C metal-binding domain-containing protein [Myxococcota bacterium]
MDLSVPTCQSALRPLVNALPERIELAELAAGRKAVEWTNGVLLSLAAGREVAAALLVNGLSLLPGAGLVAAVAPRCSGDVGGALLEAVRDGRLTPLHAAVALRIAARTRRVEACGLARSMIRREQIADVEDIVSGMAKELDDTGLLEVLQREGVPLPPADNARRLESLDALATGDVLDALPMDPPPSSTSGFTVKRAGTKIGRNDACPCGSGKKFKKCHSGREDELEVLSQERLFSMTGPELANLEGVPAELLSDHARALIRRLELEHATELIEQGDLPDELVDEALAHAAFLGRDELIPRLASRTEAPLPLAVRLRVAEDPLDVLDDAARRETPLEVAYGALDGGAPALAIGLLRGLIPIADREQAPELFCALLETRDRLGLDPVDPIEAHLARFEGWGGKVEDLVAKERAERDRIKKELDSLRVEASRMRAALGKKPRATQRSVVATPSAVDDRELADLRSKLALLKSQHKAVHEDRNRLRRHIKELQAEVPETAVAEAEVAPDDVDTEIEDATVGRQPLRIPSFDTAFEKALGELPEHVQRGAVELIGRLSAGRDDAFHNARPLRGMREVWRVRLMRSYRILFLPEDDRLRVLDILHRQDLERRIRVLWKQGVPPG